MGIAVIRLAEYEIYFSNPTKKPPTDVEWKVLSLLRKFSDSSRLSFSHRFRYNELLAEPADDTAVAE